jgi:Cu+-exporting ATPase
MDHHMDSPEDDGAVDPVCGMSVEPATAAAARSHEGETYYFCSTYCADEFDADPAQYVEG